MSSLGLALLVSASLGSTARATEVATLGGGCFWCLEAIYQELRGVEKIESGYSGGKVANPTYEQVSRSETGHAEVVNITFDPAEISFKDLLEVFFTIHDPTTRDRQGNDVGKQYRSVVFFHSQTQERLVEAVIAEFTKKKIWREPIVTEVAPFTAFYKAEAYHQQYYSKNPLQSYCAVVIAPKVAKFRKHFLSRLKRAEHK
jgi:peptide-methionine (S)-S-oxide reductase